jgi:predicted phage terminase large subunit-like protein
MDLQSPIFTGPHVLKKFNELRTREVCEENLLEFLKNGWKYIDPAPFVAGWHLEAIAEHLQAVTDGHIRRLVINVPPRTSKSTVCSVAWPAWTWAQKPESPLAGPQVQFLSSSYAQTLSLRDSVKTRRLIQSPWYQKHWGSRFVLTGDVNTKGRFENDKGGYRLATSVDGTLTGEGGDVILVDDAHSATEVESDLVRKSTLEWWDEAMSTRLNNQKTGAFVVIMQRLHQEDLTGHIITKEHDNWTWLMLPMEHEKDRHCVTYVNGARFWEDPRTEEGELLCPERFGPVEVENLKRRLGPYAAAGQLQQAPAPRGGGIIKEEWWKRWSEPYFPTCEFVLASLDTAYTEKTENDASALTIWGTFRDLNGNPKVILLYSWAERLGFPELVQKVVDSCTIDKRVTDIPREKRFRIDRLVIESKASGISVAQELHRVIGFGGNFGIELFNPTKYGDKIARAYAVQHLFSEGLIYVPWPTKDGQENPAGYAWVQEVLDEVSVFPRGAHDDRVDSMTMGLRWLRDCGFALRTEEHGADVEEEKRFRERALPLYGI